MTVCRPLAGALIWIVVTLTGSCDSVRSRPYRGRPFSGTAYHTGPQAVPGKIQCEYFDSGGEGIAYHDSDSTNSGSGGLNPADGTVLNEFRKNESVDISYTKMDGRGIDDNPFNIVQPLENQLYVGWTEPGEWLNYTVRVRESGLYKVGLQYTSNRGGIISICVDERVATGPIRIPSTFDSRDPVPWRQWHHWNRLDSAAGIPLKKGIRILTLRILTEGNMNFDFLELKLSTIR
jgi:hypothetical protein